MINIIILFFYFLLKLSQAEHAENLGADSILCLPELYFKPTSVSDLIEYLAQVGKSASKTPLFYYDFPKASMVNGM